VSGGEGPGAQVATAVSAGAIVLRESGGELRVALAHHRDPAKEWVLPKGHVEPGETVEQAALREIREETGLAAVTLIVHLGTIVRRSTKPTGLVVDKTIHYYLAYSRGGWAGTPSDARFKECDWFTPAEAIAALPYEDDRAFLRRHLAPLLGDLREP
jgi:8-oxo-dGTP pyrophosphatase MutT (NUDIX family)